MPNPIPNQITVIYAVQLPNVFQKLIVTFRRVPWIILFLIFNGMIFFYL